MFLLAYGGILGGTEVIIERIFAPGRLVAGVSHALYPQLWTDFFVELRKTRFAGLVIAISTLPFGLAVVVMHNRWTWDLSLIVTVMGWAMLFKSVVYFLIPTVANRVISGGVEREYRAFRVTGLIMVILGGLATWQAFRG